MIRHVVAGVAAANTNLGVDVGSVAVLNRSTTEDVYARTDGAAAVIEGNDSYVIPPGARRTLPVDSDGATVVSLIATAADVKVELEA